MSEEEGAEAKFGNPNDEEFFAAIGRLTLSWGHLDLGVAAMTHLLYGLFDGRKLEKEEPRALNRRINFMRAIFRRISGTWIDKGTENSFLGLVEQIEKAAEKRHNIIHGAAIQHLEGKGQATLARIHPRTGEVIHHTATAESVLQAAVEANALASLTFTFVEQINAVLQEHPQPSDKKKCDGC